MRTVSEDFETAIDGHVRELCTNATVDLTSSLFDASLSATPDSDEYDTAEQVYDGKLDPDYKYHIVGVSKIGDGTVVAGSDAEMGLWGVKSDGSGDISGGYEVMTEFSSRAAQSVLVYGDSQWEEYPVDFTVELYYDSDWHTLLDIEDNETVKYSYDFPAEIDGITKARLTVTKWSKINSRVKIIEFHIAKVVQLMDDVIIDFTLLEERQYDSDKINLGAFSANELRLEIYDDSTIAASDMRDNRLIRVQMGVYDAEGECLYCRLGEFFSKLWEPDDENDTIYIVAQDALSLLGESTYSNTEVQYDVTLYDLADDILDDSPLPSTKYNISDSLADYTIPVIVLGTITYREALRRIAEAVLGQLYVDRDGVLQIEAYEDNHDKESVKTLNNTDHIYPGRKEKFQSGNLANNIQVKYYDIYKADSASDIIESTEEKELAAGATWTATLFLPPDYYAMDEASPSFTESGADISITGYTAYSWGISVSFKNNGASAETITSITINAKPIYKIEKSVSESDADSITTYGNQQFTLANEFIQTAERAAALATILLADYKEPARDTIINTIGDPALEINDVTTIPTDETVQIIRQIFEYDGGLIISITGREYTIL